MARGLDELVESLVGEISYFGNGCTVTELVSAIKKFQIAGESENVVVNDDVQDDAEQAGSSAPITEADLSLARIAWEWLVRRGEVRVGPQGEWNHLSIDEVLALPEEVVDDKAESGMDADASKSLPTNEKNTRPKHHPATRPRLYVDEETTWKTLTGHGVDYKRVPMLEWKALIGIASAKEAGILQGDLVRLTGQDKRSVPKRTDFLAAKGYVAKRTTMVRRSKTSRLWLSKFAPPLFQNSDPSVRGSQEIKMSKDALIGTLDAVPWCDKWNNDDIDYLAFGQTFMALVKAWNVIRFRDLKQKLGILERKWQMKILAKECRRFVAMGVVQYTAAIFQDNRQVFKDCIKYVRDLTDDEWRKFLATGKKSSKYSDQTRDRQPKSAALSIGKHFDQARDPGLSISPETNAEGAAEHKNRALTTSTVWVPEKPLANTVYEAVRRAGRHGISNPTLSAVTTGFSFRRYMFTNANGMTSPDAQPPHLREFQLCSKLARIGKTTSYLYFAKDLLQASTSQSDGVAAYVGERQSMEEVERQENDQARYGFPAVPTQAFGRDSATLSSLGSIRRKVSRPGPHKTPRLQADQKPSTGGMIDISPTEAPATRKRGRPRKRKLSEVQELGPNDTLASSTEIVENAGSSNENRTSPHIPAAELEAPVPDKEFVPGVYIGQPGSLNPKPQEKTRGRPKKSLVVIFRSAKIKNLDFSSQEVADVQAPQPQQPSTGIPQLDRAIESDVADKPTVLVQSSPEDDQVLPLVVSDITTENQSTAAKEPPSRGRGRKSVGSQAGKFRCEKCGKSWKNDNGLAYHLEKSQSSCNPNYAPAPAPLGEDRPRKRRKVTFTSFASEPQNAELPAPAISGTPNLSVESVSPPRVKKLARRHALPTTGSLAPRGLQPNARAITGDDKAPELQQPKDDIPVVEEASPTAPVIIQDKTEVTTGDGFGQIPTPPAAIPALEKAISHDSNGVQPESLKTNESSTHRVEIYSDQGNPSLDNESSTRYSAQRLIPASPERPSTPRSSPSLPRALPSNSAVNVASPRAKSNNPGSPDTVQPLRQKAIDHATPNKTVVSHPEVDVAKLRFSMPASKDTAKMSESALRTYQAMEIIKYLLDNTGGVFPAERALYSAVFNVWKEDVEGKNPPSSYSCGVAVKNLMREKYIKLETYSSRNNNGAFVICQLIMRVDIDSHAPVAVAMKEKVLAALPALYIPTGFSASTSELEDTQQLSPSPQKKGTGRRDSKLAEEIEVLNAPFYARRGLKGVRAANNFRDEVFDDSSDNRRKRSGTEDGEDNFRIKRRRSGSLLSTGPLDGLRFLNTGTHPADMPILTRNGQQNQGDALDEDALVRLAAFGTPEEQSGQQGFESRGQHLPKSRLLHHAKQFAIRNPGLSSLPSEFFISGTVGAAPAKRLDRSDLRFLDPNTYLEDGPEEDDAGETNLSSAETPVKATRRKVDKLETTENPPFEDCIVLRNSDTRPDTWPDYDLAFFEANSKSFTMKGSMSRPQMVLKQILPETMDDMARRTMCRFKAEEWADPRWGWFSETINGCARWEVSKTGMDRLSRGSVAPDYIFINISTPEAVSNMRSIDPQWHEERQWTLETLPYNQLDSDTDGGHRERSKAANVGHAMVEAGRSAQPHNGSLSDISVPRKKRPYTRRNHQERPGPPKKLREHTAYPRAPEDYVRDKNNKQGVVDWAADDTRIAAFVCVGVLLGGVSKNIDWGLMCRLFPEMKVSALRRFWRSVKKDRETFINELTEKFQNEFVEAYEKNEVPAFDFDDVVSYDWPCLVKWTVELTTRNAVGLPATRKELENDFNVQSFAAEDRDWRESYHHWQRSVFNKFQDATSEPAAIVLGQDPKLPRPKLMEIAKSWIRALCCTPINKYTAVDIKNKFLGLGGQSEKYINELLETAIIELERGRIAIKNKSRALATGRPYRLNDHFLKILDRYAQEEKYTLARKFKSRLDEVFRAGNNFTIPYLTDDGMVMAIMNLQAYGRIKVESVGQPDIPFGFEPGNYETRKFPKSYYHWGLKMSPTESYVFNEDISVLGSAQDSPVPRECPDEKLPLWCDFFGELNNERWAKLLGAVLFLLATRGNMDAEAASLALQPCVEVFEVEAIMSWATRVGLVQQMVPGGGLNVCEWWWLVVGQQTGKEGDSIEES